MRFGPYEAGTLLETGGMGAVWRATDDAGAPVAVKVASDDGPFADALRREALSLAGLDDPGVVRLLAHGLTEVPPWYAMELVDGASMRSRWGGGTLSTFSDPDLPPKPRRDERGDHARLSQVRRVAETLARLHAAGLTHHDLKPENVMVRPSGEVVLIDFGLASAAAPRAREHLPSAIRGGSPRYVAPEVVAGQATDSRVDLFALGVLVFEAVTGRLPHPAEGPVDLAEALSHAGAWPDPSAPEVLASMLQRDPQRRRATAGKVAVLLGADPDSSPRVVPPVRPALRTAPPPEVLRAERVVVLGADGVGRSRTLEHFRSAWRARGSVVAGVSDAPALRVLWPAVRAALARLQNPAWLELLRTWGDVLCAVFPELAAHRTADWVPPRPLGQDASAARLRVAVVAVFAAVARQGRSALLLDDAHLADPETREVVLALVRGAAPGLRVAVATTGGDGVWTAAGCAALHLPDWTGPELEDLARQAFGGATDEALVRWATEGAAHAGEVLERLLDASAVGGLRLDGERVVASGPLPAPSELARARYDQADPEVRAALADAVARGRTFDLREALTTGARLEDLGRLLRARVIELWDGAVVFPSERVRAVVAAAVAGELPAAHLRLAAALDRSPARAAAHLELAGRPEQALHAWREATREAEQAGWVRPWLHAAGSAVRTGGDDEDRFALIRAQLRSGQSGEARVSALALLDHPTLGGPATLAVAKAEAALGELSGALDRLAPLRSPEAALQRAELLVHVGRLDDAERELLALLTAPHPTRTGVAAELALSRLLRERGRSEEGLARLQQLTPAHPDQRASTDVLRGTLCEELGLLTDAERHLRDALALAREVGDVSLISSTARTLGWVLHLAGHEEGAQGLLQDSVAMALAAGDPTGEAIGRLHLACTGLADPSCVPELRSAIARFRELGLTRGEVSAVNSLGLHLLLGASPGPAESAFARARELAAGAGLHGVVAVVDTNLAAARLAQGDLEVDHLLTLGPDEPRTRHLRAWQLVLRGDREAARSALSASFGSPPHDPDAARDTAVRAAMMEQDRGDPELAAHWIERVDEPALASALRVRGGVADDLDRQRVDAWVSAACPHPLGWWWAHAAAWRAGELPPAEALALTGRARAWLAQRPELSAPELRAKLPALVRSAPPGEDGTCDDSTSGSPRPASAMLRRRWTPSSAG